ncbi:MAG TPA: hypothetical protein VE074_00920 [Jatrophihabitantaceae bacterium]|nr:hypothetical protein [Jatrophihabitantaceae bacterium]
MEHEVSPVIRWMILAGGLALIVTGAVATYVGRLALPAGVSIVVGAAACLLAAIGRWPANLSWGSASVAFAISNQIRNEIDDVIERAPDSAKASLELVKERVSSVQQDQTPRVAAAIAYDDEVEAALRRIRPDAPVRRPTDWSRDRPDFWVDAGGRELLVETKHVGSATAFSGSSLESLLEQVAESRLLVISNAADVSRARERVTARLHDRGEVITWRSPADDGELSRAVSQLIAVDTPPAGPLRD